MKIFIIVAIFILSFPAFSRQYIQCSTYDSWDGVVINLDGDKSTLFMTNGVHLPNEIRILKDLYFDYEDELYVHYSTNEGPILDKVSVPQEVIGKTVKKFFVKFSHVSQRDRYAYGREMVCYSSIHDDTEVLF